MKTFRMMAMLEMCMGMYPVDVRSAMLSEKG